MQISVQLLMILIKSYVQFVQVKIFIDWHISMMFKMCSCLYYFCLSQVGNKITFVFKAV